ncbi:VCBS repeat-containing protein [Streptomyces goshikiensis]|uniref:VCBS repeat-containing protein n=1 Tax=Streptomyces goshikiensis TaxID=1942 RepID=UPI0038705A82|nr:VCBS repeat-containing protein [Streptomyces goshikiensis]
MSRTTLAPRGAVRRHAVRGSVVLSAAALALALTAGSAPLASQAAAATGCAGAEADFNGDGIRDTAIADPEATVNGVSKAGVVHIVYGGGKGVLELTQEAAKSGGSEAGDTFGYSMAVYDADLDGCADLAIGIPYEDVGGHTDAGRAVVVYGSPAGLAAGKASIQYVQGAAPLSGAAEADDWMGYSLAAGTSSTGVPFLAIGAPGEDLGTTPDAGSVIYASGSPTLSIGIITQDTATAGAVPDTVEPYDRFGTAIAATPTHLAISAPGEAQDTIVDAGSVTTFSHTLVSGVPTPLNVIHQDAPNVFGACEAGDAFGTSITAVPYRAEGATSTTESLLAVGIPGEDLSTGADAGAVQVFRLNAAGAYTELAWIDQNVADVGGAAEPGDHFGQRVAAFNTAPTSTSTAANVRLAVGVPGEDAANGVVDRGIVQMFPMVGAPGASDKILEPGSEIPTPMAPREYAGMSIGGGTAGLYIGMPYGPVEGRAVYLFPWTISGTGGAPIETFKPGQGGIPAEAKTFGAVVR